VYTDTPDIFKGKVDEIVELPTNLELYFLDDIKFYVMQTEKSDYTLIDGDYFLNNKIEKIKTDVATEKYYKYDKVGEGFNDIMLMNNVTDIIPYWKNDLGWYNLGLVQINNFQFDEFIEDYEKLKKFYKSKIEGIHLNRIDNCVEVSTCQYLFTLFNLNKNNTYSILEQEGDIHLFGLNNKKEFIKKLI
jgi:hypothetical protein